VRLFSAAQLTDEAVWPLLTRMTSLRSLHISGCPKLTGEGFRELVQALSAAANDAAAAESVHPAKRLSGGSRGLQTLLLRGVPKITGDEEAMKVLALLPQLRCAVLHAACS
jgi:hypothetical protein